MINYFSKYEVLRNCFLLRAFILSMALLAHPSTLF